MPYLLSLVLWLVAPGVRAQVNGSPVLTFHGLAAAERAAAAHDLVNGSPVFAAITPVLPGGATARPGLHVPPILRAAPAAGSIGELFSDETSIKTHLIRQIAAAGETIEVAIFGVTLQDVAEALVEAKGNGVQVRVVINQGHMFPTPSRQVQHLVDNGVELRTLRGNRSYGVMHNKIAVFDGRTLKTGSYNWTYSGNNKNYENAVFTQEPGYVEGYRKYWEWMWSISRPLDEGPAEEHPYGHFQGPESCRNTVTFNGVKLPACTFSPLGQTEAALLKAIEESNETIDVASYSFYSHDLAQALVAARDRGVEVRVLMDKGMGQKTPISRFLLENNMSLRWATGRSGGSMHHKYAVFDKELLETGSHNWTVNAENNCFENVLFTTERGPVRSYSAKFEELYSGAAVPDLGSLPPSDKDGGGSSSR